jgi:hypothetical protein
MATDPNYWEAPKQPLDTFDDVDLGPPRMPGVWTWFVVYSVLMALLYVLVAVFGGIMLLIPESELEGDATGARIFGVILIVVGLVFTLPFAVAPFLPKRPWVWVYDIVLIAVGMTSACTLPATIPLLIFWLKPETKRFFGKT